MGKVLFRDRIKRAKEDTAGLSEWLRNSIISGCTVVTFFGRYVLYSRQEAMKAMWLSILVFIGTFILLPMFELAWNFVRAARRMLEEQLDLEKAARLAAEERARTAELAPALNAHWRELAAKFEQETKFASAQLQTDFQDNKITRWEWTFSSDRDGACETLCEYAGTLLLKSTNVSATLSPGVKAELKPTWRWLMFLKENHNAVCIGDVMQSLTTNGYSVRLETIRNVSPVSAKACIVCAAREL
jgi:hypothetical protein